MASAAFDHPEKRASIRAFLHRQLFVTPPVPRDVDLRGKAAIVTGSNAGLGLECARQLLDLGVSKLIIAVRNETKGEAARTNLLSAGKFKDATIDVWKLDLESYESIAIFVERAKALEHLNIVVLNAGVMQHEHSLNSSTGHEQTVQINLLSTALLTILLLPVLKAKNTSESPGRIALVSSDMASWAKLTAASTPVLPTMDKKEGYHIFGHYNASKLLAQLFVFQLSQQVPPSVAIVTMPNPGLCYGTGLGLAAPGGSIADRIAAIPKRILGRSTSVGARVLTDAVVKHGVEAHGQYVEDCKVQPMAPIAYQPAGEKLRQALWDELLKELAAYHVDEILRDLTR
ncbi:hypothetical protein JX265_004626 [Neoarthrinium moseri]|uniref:NAD(P)-binding protein n=1 Tax=Neoarthrinium moseri TaxID=1658444 RepID=A0A9P9WQ88_9PEZI|nr:hypothetical protein JX265_004626 [Neoarthrinium moseri]